MPKRAFAIAMARVLRRLGPLPVRKRIPRQQQPDAIRLEYYKALLPIVHEATHAMNEWKPDILQMLMNERKRQGKYDDFAAEAAKGFVARARAMAARALAGSNLEMIAARFARRTADFQKGQIDRQVVAALSVPLSMIEHPVVEKIGSFVRENVALITSVHERYFDRIEKDIAEAYAKGTHPTDLAEMFVERDGMAERDAMRIARDQIGKLNAEVNEERQKSIGITSYIWRTANDNRVRDEHAELEGKSFTWDDPPDAGTNGEPANPGEAINCRCFAEPDFSPLLDGI